MLISILQPMRFDGNNVVRTILLSLDFKVDTFYYILFLHKQNGIRNATRYVYKGPNSVTNFILALKYLPGRDVQEHISCHLK